MMRCLLVLSILAFFSCNNNEANILSIREMQDIQWDLMRADEMVDYYKLSDSLYPFEQKRMEYYNKVYSIHHTNKEDFTRSMHYYTARPALLKQIVEGVHTKGQRQERTDSVKALTSLPFWISVP